MCGIAGWINWNKSISGNDSKNIIKKMCDVIAHRGPDDEGFYLNNEAGAALGMRRLSIIDLKTGSQPISNEDKTIFVVCNGEIYNFKELRLQLENQGHKFHTNSDVEVIVHLYEEKKYGLLSSLRGMYAFALWDQNEGKLFLGRDRIGKKPLSYCVQGGSLIFGSEIKSILQFPGINREPDLEALDLYLTYQYVPSPLSAFKNIKKLPPAHYLVCDLNGSVKIEKYWNLSFQNKLSLPENEWEKIILDKIREATKIRMISDVPLGAFLSGGIDSSAVVAMMAQESSQPVKTFSIGFAEQDFSELKYARMAAKHIGTDHHEFIVTPHAADILPKLAWHYGEPFADSSAFPSYYVAQQTRQHVTVALNGDGGDESFAGYFRYRAVRLSEYIAPVNHIFSYAVTPFSQWALSRSSGKLRKFWHRVNMLSSALNQTPARRNIKWHSIFDNVKKQDIYSQSMKTFIADKDSYAYLENLFNNAPCLDNIDRLLFTDLMSYLPECLLVKIDIATMANSLEGRSPFLDHELIELAAQMPSSLKLKGFTSKYILKKAFKNLLPKEILHRRKMGFGIPVNQWFRKELKDYVRDIICSQKALNRGYFSSKSIENLINEHNNGYSEHGYRLWSLLMLELWHREFID